MLRAAKDRPRPAEPSRRFEPLNASHRASLAALAWNAVHLASSDPELTRVAVDQIKHLAWRWTADAFCPRRNVVIPDAIKYDFHHQHHTVAARERARSWDGALGKVLRHEHVVPRRRLAEEALKCGTLQEVRALLEANCLAVLVTIEEDRRFGDATPKLFSRMPEGWTLGQDPFARYSHEKVVLAVEPPLRARPTRP